MNFRGIELSADMIWISVGLALIVCVLSGIQAWRTLDAPPSFFDRYAASVTKRHGQGFVVSVGTLLIAIGAGLLTFFLGFSPSKGASVFIALLPVVFSWVVIWDIWQFWQAERKSSK